MNNPQNNTKLPHYDPKNNNKSSLEIYLQARKDHRSRIVAVFVKDLPSPSVDLDFWRKNALKTSEDFAKYVEEKKTRQNL